MPDPRTTATGAGLSPSASECTLTHLMTLLDANLHGNIHGGVIMKLVDDAAGVVAARHSGGRAVTVSMDEMVFLVPVHIGDLINVRARINWAGRSSMEIGVRVEAEDMISGRRRHTNSCYLTFVAVDRNGRPVDVPPVIPLTADDERRFAAAKERRRRRLEERTAEEREGERKA